MKKRIVRAARRRSRAAKKRLGDAPYALASRLRDFDPRESLVICSDPRGGSTWITEVVSQVPRTSVLWEPLNLRHVPYFRRLGFPWGDPRSTTSGEYPLTSPLAQHIPEGASWPEAERAFEALFRGKVLNGWIGFMASPVELLRAERLLIKFCHANALLPWLTRTFDLAHAPVYLVRHPFAVVASQLRHGNWRYAYDGFPIPQGRYAERYAEHAAFLSELKTRAEIQTAAWCFSNLVPLRSAQNDRAWITVYYEHLLRRPKEEVERIFGRWGRPLPEAALEKLREPSASTKEATFQESIEKQLAKWRTSFTADELARMEAVLDHFEVAHYRADSPFPCLSDVRGNHDEGARRV